MNALLPVGSLRRRLSLYAQHVRQSRFAYDRLSLSLLGGALMVNLVNLAWLALRAPVLRADVPLRYSSLGGFEGLGPWYGPLLMAAFGLGVTLANGLLAYRAFERSRLASFYLLGGAGVVAIFGFIISNAFATVGQ